MKPKKIFFAWNYLDWGGAQIYFFGLMKEMKNHCEVVAILPENSNEQLLKFLRNLQIPYEFFPHPADLKSAPTLKRKLQRHWNKIKSEISMLKHLGKSDLSDSIVHVELAPWQSMLALIWLSRKSKVFVTVHNSVLPIPEHRRLLWRVKFAVLARIKNFHIFTANNDAKNSLKSLVPQNFFDDITVTYANINPSEINEVLQIEIDREGICRTYELPPHKFLVFCVGQFIDRKGRWIFLEAAKKLLETNEDMAFVWISNSKPDAADYEKIKSFRLGDDFRLVTSDQIGNEHIDLFKLLRVAGVFVLPSYVEGLPISLLEAMALGIPSVSTEINGIPEAVKSFETGILIEAGNSVELASAVERLKNDSFLRARLASGGRAFVLKNFSEPVVAKIAADEYFDSFR